MRGKIIFGRITLTTLLLMVLFLVIFTQPVLASNNLEIIGGENGLKVVPQDEKLFNELNMAPGDRVEGKLTIRNEYLDTFILSLKAERLNSGLLSELFNKTPDLYKQLLMKVNFRGETIYDGPMDAFASDDGISLGEFKPGEEQDLEIQVHLPGATTGNEFMGQTLKNKWILTAQSETVIIDDEDPPFGPGEIPDEGTEIIEDEEIPIGKAKIPQTGGTPASFFFIAGALVATTGIVLKKKK